MGMQTASCSVRETNSVHFQSLKLKFSQLWIGTEVEGFEFYGIWMKSLYNYKMERNIFLKLPRYFV